MSTAFYAIGSTGGDLKHLEFAKRCFQWLKARGISVVRVSVANVGLGPHGFYSTGDGSERPVECVYVSTLDSRPGACACPSCLSTAASFGC